MAALLLEKDWRPEAACGWKESAEAGGRVTREGRQGVGWREARLTGREENICCCSEVSCVSGGGKYGGWNSDSEVTGGLRDVTGLAGKLELEMLPIRS